MTWVNPSCSEPRASIADCELRELYFPPAVCVCLSGLRLTPFCLCNAGCLLHPLCSRASVLEYSTSFSLCTSVLVVTKVCVCACVCVHVLGIGKYDLPPRLLILGHGVLGAHNPRRRGRAPLTMLCTCFAVWHACFLTCQKRTEYVGAGS